MYYAGMAQSALGRYHEAEASLLQALSTYRESSPRFDLMTVLWELGQLYSKMGDTEKTGEMEAQMRAAALASTTKESARDADNRFYALALLGCREQWKIRTVMYHCFGSPSDADTALEYARKAYAYREASVHNRTVLALSLYFSGNHSEAVSLMKEVIADVHEDNPTMNNLQSWLRRFEQ